jgi:uncharacterized protein (DUF58 family)
MDEITLLQKVRRIEIKAKRLSEQLFSGEYHSAFKGMGMSFAEVRPYSYGDDWRHIDWNVSARTGEHHVKVYQEERELTVMLLVDVSRSTHIGSTDAFKKDRIVELCAVIAWSAMLNNDRIGLILFDEKPIHVLFPAKGKMHTLHIIRDLLHINSQSEKSDLNNTLEYLNHLIKRRAICFLISDFYVPDFDKTLKISSKRHEMIGLCCQDMLDLTIPDLGLVLFQNPETGQKRWVDSSSMALKKELNEKVRNRIEKLKKTFQESGSDLIEIPSNDRYLIPLIQHLSTKKRTK